MNPTTDVIIGTIAALFFLMLIGWQIYLLMAQRIKYKELENDYTEFKFSIEDTLKTEVNEIIRQNKELVKTVNKLIENKII